MPSLTSTFVQQRQAMSNKTTCSSRSNFSISGSSKYNYSEKKFYPFVGTFGGSIIIAVLSPVAVVSNALILVTILKRTFQRTAFHTLLSGLVFTDLCTGLIAQPVNAVTILLYTLDARTALDKPPLFVAFETIADATTTYFISVSMVILTLMAVERWLHMSRRPLTLASLRYCLSITVFLVIPAPLVVSRSLETIKPGSVSSMLRITIITTMSLSFLITFVAYINVLRIIRSQQLQVQAVNGPPQNIGRPTINLIKYKKSVITILYFLALFCVCFLPFVITSGVFIHGGSGNISERNAAFSVSRVLLFLSSSLNPFLYLWRMSDIRNGVKQLLCSRN